VLGDDVEVVLVLVVDVVPGELVGTLTGTVVVVEAAWAA
jgi:hypothetical protein